MAGQERSEVNNPVPPEVLDLSNYPKTGCNPRKIQDLRAFSVTSQ